MNKNSEVIKEEGIIAIMRGLKLPQAIDTAKALYEGGIKVIEAAFDAKDEHSIDKNSRIIEGIRKALGDEIILGAGTVLKTEQLVAAYEAGAEFIFSPNVNTEIIHKTKRLGMVSVPGALTPSEIMSAYDSGADIIKLFPITLEDIGYVVNITRPLSHIPFICVGGVNEDTIGAFFKAGAIGVGTGISILKPQWLAENNYREITNMARIHLEKVREAQYGT